MKHRGKHGCKIIGVPRDACYVRFGMRTAVVASSDMYMRTARGEDVVLDFDVDGNLLGIELIGGKPCQQPPKR